MSYRSIIEAFRAHPLTAEALSQTEDMLAKAGALFSAAARAYLDQEAVGFDLYAGDRKINKLEMKVRRSIAASIAERHVTDVSGELVITSAVIDVERIGDFSKNILELSEVVASDTLDDRYADGLRHVLPKIEALFPLATEALLRGDEEAGIKGVDAYQPIKEACDGMIAELLKSDLPPRLAIPYTLGARYFKRVGAHLANVCSSAVNPFHKIGFKPEKA